MLAPDSVYTEDQAFKLLGREVGPSRQQALQAGFPVHNAPGIGSIVFGDEAIEWLRKVAKKSKPAKPAA